MSTLPPRKYLEKPHRFPHFTILHFYGKTFLNIQTVTHSHTIENTTLQLVCWCEFCFSCENKHFSGSFDIRYIMFGFRHKTRHILYIYSRGCRKPALSLDLIITYLPRRYCVYIRMLVPAARAADNNWMHQCVRWTFSPH